MERIGCLGHLQSPEPDGVHAYNANIIRTVEMMMKRYHYNDHETCRYHSNEMVCDMSRITKEAIYLQARGKKEKKDSILIPLPILLPMNIASSVRESDVRHTINHSTTFIFVGNT